MDYILQFKSDRLAYYDSFLACAYEDELADLDARAERVNGSDKAIDWLFENLADKSLGDAWSLARNKASEASRGLTYSNRNRSANASKADFWEVIVEFIAWLTSTMFEGRRNLTLAQVRGELDS